MGLISLIRKKFAFMNRRVAPRIQVNLPADFAQDDESVYLFRNTVDISRTGAFIQTKDLLEVGSVLELDLTLINEADFSAPHHRVVCMAEVVRVVDPEDPKVAKAAVTGMGVRFLDLLQAEWERIKEFISKKAQTGEEVKPQIKLQIAEITKEEEKRQIEEIKRYNPELKREVSDLLSDALPEKLPDYEEEDSSLDEKLIEEIEARMSSNGPDLVAVNVGDAPPAKRNDPNFELRSDGTVEAKRTSNELGLIANVKDDDDLPPKLSEPEDKTKSD